MEVSPSRELVLLDSEPGFFACYALQNIMISCWSKGGTGPSVARVAEQRAVMDKQHPEGVSVVWLIANDAGLPTAEARAGVKQLMERYRGQRACLAVVVQGEGFWASAMRAVITGVRMLVPGQLSMRVCGKVEEVVAWLPSEHESVTGTAVAPQELRAVLNRLMAAL